jgi:hypothetical protein
MKLMRMIRRNFLLAPFIFIEGIKKAIDMRLVIVVISSLVLILSVCLDVWHLRPY